MSPIRIRRRLASPIPELPELTELVGKEVEIVAREAEGDAQQAFGGEDRTFRPVGDWDGPLGEFDRLMEEVRSSRDTELEREARP